MNTNLTKKLLGCTFALLVAVPGALLAQEKAADMPASQAPAAASGNPITQSEKGLYNFISGTVVSAAQKMPEENYSFKPTPEVRSFGQIVGHVADAQYMFCAAAIGETAPSKDIEKTKTSKADLIAALKEGQAYCNKAYASMTDAKGAEMIKMMGFPMARMAVFSLNNAHTDEHYGNLVTYMRLKGLVPPTSENQGPPPAAK
jgi:uncharacterized damage-inducible protein DinB